VSVKYRRARPVGFGLFGLLLLGVPLCAQSPKEIVQQAVQTELAAARNDHSHWRFRQDEKLPVQIASIVVETAQGSVSQKIEENGRPLSAEQAAAEAKRVQNFIHDSGLQQKQKRDGQHDDDSAAKLLEMLPTAFKWSIASQTPSLFILSFNPDSGFNPDGMEARVMSTMHGTLIVDRAQHRIQSIQGALSEDVNIGFGLLGKLRKGGTFDVERREIAPGLWQIVETHVHIEGRALLFKTIGQQQDEVNSGYSRVPDSTTLEQAVALLSSGKNTGCASCNAR
jgi:hypothetical protein